MDGFIGHNDAYYTYYTKVCIKSKYLVILLLVYELMPYIHPHMLAFPYF